MLVITQLKNIIIMFAFQNTKQTNNNCHCFVWLWNVVFYFEGNLKL